MDVTKKRTCRLLIFSLLSTIFFSATPLANAKDVTNTISGKTKIVKLCKEFTNFAGYQQAYVMTKGETSVYAFTKADLRRKMLQYYQSSTPASAKKLKQASKDLFGVPTSKLMDQIVGDWGTSGPEIKVTKIEKTSKKKYKVKANLYWVDFMTSDHVRTKNAKLTFQIQKSNASKYGYIIKKLTIEKIN